MHVQNTTLSTEHIGVDYNFVLFVSIVPFSIVGTGRMQQWTSAIQGIYVKPNHFSTGGAHHRLIWSSCLSEGDEVDFLFAERRQTLMSPTSVATDGDSILC